MTSHGVSVTLEGVTRRFGRAVAVDGVSFEMVPGEVLGLLGPNGAGKTTTMRVLTGFLRPTAGRVLVGGVDMAADPVAAKRMLGYMPEGGAGYPEMTVEGYLRHWARLRSLPRRARAETVARTIAKVGLRPVARQRIGTLSKGYRQRVGLAQALLHDPPVLVLDEPTAGLDPRQVVETRELIAKLGRRRTVLLSSHLLSEVTQLCRRVVVLDQGKVVAVDEVERLTAASGTRLEVAVTGDLERAAGVVRAVPGVVAVDVRGTTLVVQGSGDDLQEVVSRALVGGGFGLRELRVTARGTLEEAYLRLVGDR